MVFVVGVVIFALGIATSVALHECGHMWSAQATGMKVRRYFVGFGPKVFSVHRNGTEYGLKAIPLGGFCDIAGMTALDEVEPHELERAMYRQKTWKRLLVMFCGIAMNFLLGFLLIFLLAVTWGLPNINQPPPTALGKMECAPSQKLDGSLIDCSGEGPAQKAGLLDGDVVTAVNGVKVDTWSDFTQETQKQTGPFTYTIERGGHELTVPVQPDRVQRLVIDKNTGAKSLKTVSAIGAAKDYYEDVKYNPLAAIPASVAFTGDLAGQTFHSLAQMPTKVVNLWHAVTGGQRDADTPISVVGASKIGGDLAERDLWGTFILLLASLNFFLGAFNLLPLLPLDGGHMAVTIYEKIRNMFRSRKGLPAGAPVDYLKLMPATYVVIFIGGAYMLLTLTADIINPIQLFQ
ncbi:M50 family metallopeptidase [Antrihabitans cavernicola]|uniref:Zinc metalloprotease Rip1 n=1 Tax=Antrihabitans cavernicola TaxID=2495913 RepID=A0A5A7SCY5_9NOCA|nr:M50 family metallopeptidase [Spelaeibacter cavernicola]KAA0023239.1 site-2 protease family protein [Spelaeibacter cavernicola]